MKMAHIWIEIVGPDELGPPLPGTTGSLPTRYYYTLPHQIDSTLARVGLWLAGIDSQLVKEITLGGEPGGTRQGKVIEKKDPLIKYDWTESSKLWPASEMVTGRRLFYRQYGRFIKRKSEGIVTCKPNFLGDGEVVLNADPDSSNGGLRFGKDLHGVTNPVEISSCRAKIRAGFK